MKFSPNKTPTEIINEAAFGGTYFRNILILIKNCTKKFMERICSFKRY